MKKVLRKGIYGAFFQEREIIGIKSKETQMQSRY